MIWNVRLTIAAVLVACGGYVGWFLTSYHDRVIVSNLRVDLADAQASLRIQNAAVATWQAEAAARSKRAEAAIKEAGQARADANAAAHRLLTAKLPEDECHALALLVDLARSDPDLAGRVQ